MFDVGIYLPLTVYGHITGNNLSEFIDIFPYIFHNLQTNSNIYNITFLTKQSRNDIPSAI